MVAKKTLAMEMSKVTGISKNSLNKFLLLIVKFMVHEVACKVLDSTDGKLKSFDIEIPKIGKFEAVLEDKEIKVRNFDISDIFREYLDNAINKGISPLNAELDDLVVKVVKEKYNALV